MRYFNSLPAGFLTMPTTFLHRSLQYLRGWYVAYEQLASKYRTVSLAVGTVLLIGLIVLLFLDNVSLTPDIIIVVLFIAAIAFGQALPFLRDWLPFVGVLLVYESMHGFADDLGQVAHSTDLIATERFLFGGTVPTLWLQQHLWQGAVSWYDWLFTLTYFMHFVLPLGCAFWLWTRYRHLYWQFVLSLVALCFAGFVTYVVFPATPPWLAAKQGDLPEVIKVIDQVLAQFPQQMTISTLYHNLNPNPVAAMPSLHAAFPMLVLLMLWQVVKKKAVWFLIYCGILWLGIVYMGEHYVIDAIAGILYSAIVFFGTRYLYRRFWARPSDLPVSSVI